MYIDISKKKRFTSFILYNGYPSVSYLNLHYVQVSYPFFQKKDQKRNFRCILILVKKRDSLRSSYITDILRYPILTFTTFRYLILFFKKRIKKEILDVY